MSAALWERLAAAQVIDLAHPMRGGMPQSPNHPPFRMTLERRHGDMVRADGGSAANELIITGGHVGTHVDALGHVSQDGYLFGRRPTPPAQSHRGLAELGIDTVAPAVGRGVLLDVAAEHGTETLPAGYEITVADLERAQKRAGVRLLPGDVVLVATGWSRHWHRPDVFVGSAAGVPGPGEEAARWLAAHRPAMVGGETIAFEHIPAESGHARLPVHRIMLVEAGINIVETMCLTRLRECAVGEFSIVMNPLPIIGATGAPVRPLALVEP
ncbi:cyclase family protein [Plantactinospora sp. KBS50]|uniref:cyclase family protein n=1 Tax=Plantactinospora sp. KBS50 TaxID=2024580 RepID=UPI000BAAC177|nr:cyclase family protein [Plantactinospora sp. KBS50]ASW56596.1 cyclase [Plantactinospora sp. KBS50]